MIELLLAAWGGSVALAAYAGYQVGAAAAYENVLERMPSYRGAGR